MHYPGSSHPYTWRIEKLALYKLMAAAEGGGYLYYNGPAGDPVGR